MTVVYYDPMTNRQYGLYALFLFVLIFVCAAFWYQAFRQATTDNKDKHIDEPLDVVLDYYNEWLGITKTTGRPQADAEVINRPILAATLQEKLRTSLRNNDPKDPLLCQNEVPDTVAAKVVHELPTETVIMVYSRFASSTPTGYALVTLTMEDRTWRMHDVVCTSGDVDTEREFTFEASGQLIKDSAPEPLDKSMWHLVFTENGMAGHTTPLRFGTTSSCTTLDGATSVCSLDMFKEADYVAIKGQMTESGVDVVSLNFVTPTN